MPKAFYKHKILLDEHLPPRQFFSRLNERFDVKHIKHDLHRAGVDDGSIYDLAIKEARLILTINVKDFRALLRDNTHGIIGIPEAWSAERLDSKLTALLTRHGPKHFRGHYIPLAGLEDN